MTQRKGLQEGWQGPQRDDSQRNLVEDGSGDVGFELILAAVRADREFS